MNWLTIQGWLRIHRHRAGIDCPIRFSTPAVRLYTHLEVGRNKPVRAIARTGVSGKLLTNSPETPPRAIRWMALFRPTSRAHHSKHRPESTLQGCPLYLPGLSIKPLKLINETAGDADLQLLI